MASEGIFGLGIVTGKWVPYAIGGASSRICLKVTEDIADRMMAQTNVFNKRIEEFIGRIMR